VLSESDLMAWAAKLGRTAVDARLFVALYGPLGAGKSTLVRAACRGVGVHGPIPSPTFTLLNQYSTPGGDPISHVDLYRIDTKSELLDLGWEELLAREHPIFVEWAERAAGYLPPRRWDVVLGIAEDPTLRTVRVTPIGAAPDPPPAQC
jgi:tRNA threonylcarbamoyladenosine biosynthesis protein TsaE